MAAHIQRKFGEELFDVVTIDLQPAAIPVIRTDRLEPTQGAESYQTDGRPDYQPGEPAAGFTRQVLSCKEA
jgi:hypothetical protein